MECLRRYFNRITTFYKCEALSNNDEKKFRFFVSDYLNCKKTLSIDRSKTTSLCPSLIPETEYAALKSMYHSLDNTKKVKF